MRSARPKVLHTLGGRHLLQHVLGAAVGLGATRTIVVTGHGAEEVEKSAHAPGLAFVRQQPQLGTGHALQQAAPLLDDDATTLVLNGDVPLIETETLQRARRGSPCSPSSSPSRAATAASFATRASRRAMRSSRSSRRRTHRPNSARSARSTPA